MKTGLIGIAIADDHTLFRTTLAHILTTNYGITVLAEANNGAELLEKLRTIKPQVILLDVEMPIMTGPEALMQIRKDYPYVHIIMLSTHNDHVLISQLMEMGATVYLTKSTDPQIIHETILDILKQIAPE